METIKSFTSLEQSKKLAEILPLDSADMRYAPFGDTHPWVWDGNLLERGATPCWSLAALLSVLDFPSLTQNKEDEWEVCVFDHDNDDYIGKTASNPVNACYEVIIKLYELKML